MWCARRWAFVLLWCCLLPGGLHLTASAAAAQGASDLEPTAAGGELDADALLERGVALRRAGDDQAAAVSFARAYAVSPTPRAAAQLGLARQALGQWVDAHAHLTEALAAGEDPWVARNRAALEQALAVVQAEVGSVQVIVPADVVGARARVGGRELPLPMAQPVIVVAGQDVVEVEAPGFRTARRDVRVRPGQLSRVSVELVREEPVVVASAVDAAASTSGSSAAAGGAGTAEGRVAPPADESWVVWVIVGAVAAVGVGVAIAVVASQQSLEPPLPGTQGAVELLRF